MGCGRHRLCGFRVKKKSPWCRSGEKGGRRYGIEREKEKESDNCPSQGKNEHIYVISAAGRGGTARK